MRVLERALFDSTVVMIFVMFFMMFFVMIFVSLLNHHPVDLRIDRHVDRSAAASAAAVATAVSLTPSSPSVSSVLQAPAPLVAERQPQVVVEGHHTLTLKVNKFKCKRAADLSSMHTKD